MKPVKEGDKIPDFTLPDQFGSPFEISSLVGKKMVVIFFYPRDESPTCTRQACHFRDMYQSFVEAGAEIIGISSQSVKSHLDFASKYNLQYRILSDEGNRVRKLFGVPSDFFGLMPGRVTYVADLKGTVIYIFSSQLNVEKHVDEALKILFLMKSTGRKDNQSI
jgi:peroxiredoxin Q/BCP